MPTTTTAQLTNEGVIDQQAHMLTGSSSPTLFISLFTNNLTKDSTLTFADFTFPADTGSQPQNYSSGITLSSTSAVGATSWNSVFFSWIFTGTPSESYAGYVVYNTTGDISWWMDTFASPVSNNGSIGGIMVQSSGDFGQIDAS